MQQYALKRVLRTFAPGTENYIWKISEPHICPLYVFAPASWHEFPKVGDSYVYHNTPETGTDTISPSDAGVSTLGNPNFQLECLRNLQGFDLSNFMAPPRTYTPTDWLQAFQNISFVDEPANDFIKVLYYLVPIN